MTTHPVARLPTVYSAAYFCASPTFNTWVKLTAADVHALRAEPAYEGKIVVQNIYFHLNHPIRFVRIVGLIVAIDEYPTCIMLTLDDSSGTTIDLRIGRLAPAAAAQLSCGSNTTVENLRVESAVGLFKIVLSESATQLSSNRDVRSDTISLNQAESRNRRQNELGKKETCIEIGTVIRARCTLSSFRGARQLELRRVAVVHSTADELAAWNDLESFRREVLSAPWTLSREQRANIDKELENEKRRTERRMRKNRELEKHNLEKRRIVEEKIKTRDEKMQKKNREEAAIMNAGALI